MQPLLDSTSAEAILGFMVFCEYKRIQTDYPSVETLPAFSRWRAKRFGWDSQCSVVVHHHSGIEKNIEFVITYWRGRCYFARWGTL